MTDNRSIEIIESKESIFEKKNTIVQTQAIINLQVSLKLVEDNNRDSLITLIN